VSSGNIPNGAFGKLPLGGDCLIAKLWLRQDGSENVANF
jgi:hypothetical protein